MIVAGISGNAGCGLPGPDLGGLGMIAEIVEDRRCMSPGRLGLGRPARAALRDAEEPQREGFPVPVAGGPVHGQRLPQLLEGLRVASQREIGAPDVVQRVPDTMREAAISECAVRLLEARDGLLSPA